MQHNNTDNSHREKQELIMKVLHPEVFIEKKIDPHLAAWLDHKVDLHFMDFMNRNNKEMPRDASTNYGLYEQEQQRNEFKTNNYQLLKKYNREQTGTEEQCTVRKCENIIRIINALKYFQSLDNMNNEDQQNLVEFCDKYQSLLDDYIHILGAHNNDHDLEKIFDLMINDYKLKDCDIIKCTLSLRYYRNRHIQSNSKYIENNKTNQFDELQFLFYRDVMDQIHCYLYHLYDTALRIKKPQIKHDTT
eukprot:35561_1